MGRLQFKTTNVLHNLNMANIKETFARLNVGMHVWLILTLILFSPHIVYSCIFIPTIVKESYVGPRHAHTLSDVKSHTLTDAYPHRHTNVLRIDYQKLSLRETINILLIWHVAIKYQLFARVHCHSTRSCPYVAYFPSFCWRRKDECGLWCQRCSVL